MIDSLPESSEISYVIEGVEYINSFELMKQFDSPFCQFLKEAKPCKVTYEQNGKQKSIVGILGLSGDDVDRFKKVVIHTPDDQLTLNIKDILKLEEVKTIKQL